MISLCLPASRFFGVGRRLCLLYSSFRMKSEGPLEWYYDSGREISMKIHGFQKTTLLDYPEHVAATIFLGGCNFRCPFCHNGQLVLDPASQPVIPEDEVLAYLEKRHGILEGVCITGGEPTLQEELADFIQRIKGLGYMVKLDTNGYRPEVLKALLQKGLLDYVAMDIKASPEHYSVAAGLETLDMTRIRESIRLLEQSGIPHEFRTTVVKGIHRTEEFDEIGRLLQGCTAYYLQGFRRSESMIGEGYEAFSVEEMKEMAALAEKYLNRVELRGVE